VIPRSKPAGTGQLGEIEDLNFCRNTYPVVKVRALTGPPAPLPVAVPAIRWSVASGEDTDQGLDVVVLTHDDGSRTSLRTVDGQCVGPEGRLGWDPSYSVLLWCCLAQVSIPPSEHS
jgi:hypothetical protein